MFIIISIVEKQTYLLIVKELDLQEGKSYANENGLFFLETLTKIAKKMNELFYEIGMFHQYISMSIIFYYLQVTKVKLSLKDWTMVYIGPTISLSFLCVLLVYSNINVHVRQEEACLKFNLHNNLLGWHLLTNLQTLVRFKSQVVGHKKLSKFSHEVIVSNKHQNFDQVLILFQGFQCISTFSNISLHVVSL